MELRGEASVFSVASPKRPENLDGIFDAKGKPDLQRRLVEGQVRIRDATGDDVENRRCGPG